MILALIGQGLVPVFAPVPALPPPAPPIVLSAPASPAGPPSPVTVPASHTVPVAESAPASGGVATPLPAPATTTTTTQPSTSRTGFECVVTLTDPSGNVMTYSPGPAVNGACSEGTPEPYTVTGP